MSEFGEIAEHYTNTAVLQLQRIDAKRKSGGAHQLNVTIAPLQTGSENKRRADFSQKLTMQLTESDMANFAIGLMGLRPNTRIKSSQVGEEAKVVYVNVNDNQTTSVIISVMTRGNTTNTQLQQSICFENSERYPLLRLVVTQLARNSTQYEQSVADTLNLLKASVLR